MRIRVDWLLTHIISHSARIVPHPGRILPDTVKNRVFARNIDIYWAVDYSLHRTVRCLAENIGNPPLLTASRQNGRHTVSSVSMFSAPEIGDFRHVVWLRHACTKPCHFHDLQVVKTEEMAKLNACIQMPLNQQCLAILLQRMEPPQTHR